MNCPVCGAQIKGNDKFCEVCGIMLKREEKFQNPDLKVLSALEAELTEITNQMSSLASKRAYLGQLNQLLQQKWQELNYVHNIMQKEKKDYEDLLHTSFSSFKAKVSGNIDEKKRKEEAEYLEALARYKGVEQDYGRLQNETQQLTADITRLDQLGLRAQALNEQWRQLVVKLTAGKKTERLIQLEAEYSQTYTKLGETREFERQFREADSYLARAESSLSEANSNLQSAGDYGTWDAYFGGGFFVDGMKHDKLERSRYLISDAQANVLRAQGLIRGLQNLYIHFEAPSFFVDAFFDNFFVDMLGNSKIHRTQERVRDALYQLRNNRDFVKRSLIGYSQQTQQLAGQLNNLQRVIDQERRASIKI